MSGNGREALRNDRECSEGPPGCSGVVKRPSRMSAIDWDALGDFSGEVENPSRMSRIGREALPDVR